MNVQEKAFRLFPASAITSLIADSFVAAGVPDADARKVAALMTEADLTGADGHGVLRLPQYVKRLKAGGFNTRPDITVTRTAPATAMVDGDNGMGHLVVSRATETAIDLARESGVAWVGVRRSNHAGTAGIYAEMPVRHGMIGIYAAVASANHMAAWGGSELLLGTNPLAIAVPSGAGAMVLDMATTIVSYGTVKKHALQGVPLEPGWMIDRTTGEPVLDPTNVSNALLLPIGGYKGSGLSIMLGILGGILNGAAFGRDCIDFNADPKSETNTGQFVVVIEIERFVPLATFTAEVDRHMADLRASKRLPGIETIRMPGDRRRECRAERSRDGVPVPAALITQLDAVAAELGVTPLAARG